MQVVLPAMGNETVLGQAYSARMRGEMSAQEYNLLCATWASDNLNQYRPRFYQSLDDSLFRYINRRIADLRNSGTFQADLYVKLSRRTLLTYHEIDINSSTKEDLLWCLEKVREVSLKTVQDKLESALARFDHINIPTWFNNAVSVVETDSVLFVKNKAHS